MASESEVECCKTVGDSKNNTLRKLVGIQARPGDSDWDLIQKWTGNCRCGDSEYDMLRRKLGADWRPGDSVYDILRKLVGAEFKQGDTENALWKKKVASSAVPPVVLGDFRITEEGDTRITEAGDFRIYG